MPDRDQILQALTQRGIAARAVDDADWSGIEVPCDGDAGAACVDVLHQVEGALADASLPLVPILGDGRVFLRPPGD